MTWWLLLAYACAQPFHVISLPLSVCEELVVNASAVVRVTDSPPPMLCVARLADADALDGCHWHDRSVPCRDEECAYP